MSYIAQPQADVNGLISRLVAKIDELLSRQLDEILHHPRFQYLESCWRGLHMLLEDAPKNRRTKICVLNIGWSEIVRDMERSLEFDQSMLFWKLHTTEFDMPGGEPFGAIICNYSVSHKNASDIRTLRRMAAVAEASFCTMIFPADAKLFGMDSFADLHPSIDPQKLFRETEYRLWQLLRKDPSSRFLAFVLPGVLLRKPWGMMGARRGNFPYIEQCHRSNEFLWGHAGFVLARILLREFEEVGWFAHIRGAPRDTLAGGIVADVLPVIQVDPTDELVSVLPPAELAVTDGLERDLSECGLTALVQCWQTPYSAFFSLPSLFSPESSHNEQRDNNERIASQVQNILCASRFAHYIKVMMREKIGSFLSAAECQTFMEEWLTQYCTAGENLNWSTKARYPLRSIRINVRDKPLAPGHYLCDIHLAPHYQYDGLVGEVKLTTEIARAQ
jgi:type VI secretion system protein ImpD